MKLYWHDYEYFEYERKLGHLEVKNLLKPDSVKYQKEYLSLEGVKNLDTVARLVYFSKAETETNSINTLQHKLETNSAILSHSKNKQATRYSVHGIHEYKGKFNPQVVRATLNILDIPEKSLVFDPFCGSGTSLVECYYGGYSYVGIDNNPLAILIAKAKLDLLYTPAEEIFITGNKIIKSIKSKKEIPKSESNDLRNEYLTNWFSKNYLSDFERLKYAIDELPEEKRSIYYILASNLIRNYSLQEPSDLRIRRRFSPFPKTPVFEAFKKLLDALVINLKAQPKFKNRKIHELTCIEGDSRAKQTLSTAFKSKKINASITSPPYAMALPYIDIQRLSLIWLNSCKPSQIKELENKLIGSREYLQKEKGEWQEAMLTNKFGIPEAAYSFCKFLYSAIGPNDGFRRKAVPSLLYRYLVGMSEVFENTYPYFLDDAPFALIVGHNSTVLNGKKIDIDTPKLLSELATNKGWNLEQKIPLDTYYRYNLHSKNSINSENMLILRK